MNISAGGINNSQNGLTLIEVLVAIVILGMLGGGLLSLQFILSQNQILVFKNYLSVDEANANVTSFVRELRTARSGDNGSYPLETVNNQGITFYSDVDFDGDTEKVRYFLNGTEFSKGVIEPTAYPVSYPPGQEKVRVLTDNIRNGATEVFFYYDGGWPQDTVNNPLQLSDRLSDTKTVRIYLRLNPKSNEPDSDYILESYVQIRMLKDNL